jgi:hypothetical protein
MMDEPDQFRQALLYHLALRHARNGLKASIVRTNHNTRNLAIIAIHRKPGYRLLPDAYLLMEKQLG